MNSTGGCGRPCTELEYWMALSTGWTAGSGPVAGKLAKRWRFIVAAAVVLGVIVLSTGQQDGQGSGTGGSGPCMMTVTAESLNVRSGPDSREPVVATLAEGAVVSANLTTRNGYRELGPDSWAAQLYLRPEPGSDCG